LIREWNTLFLNSKPIGSKRITDPATDSIKSAFELGEIEPEELEMDPIAILDSSEFQSYLDGKNGWLFKKGYFDLTIMTLKVIEI
jgi:hypothetical protein